MKYHVTTGGCICGCSSYNNGYHQVRPGSIELAVFWTPSVLELNSVSVSKLDCSPWTPSACPTMIPSGCCFKVLIEELGFTYGFQEMVYISDTRSKRNYYFKWFVIFFPQKFPRKEIVCVSFPQLLVAVLSRRLGPNRHNLITQRNTLETAMRLYHTLIGLKTV